MKKPEVSSLEIPRISSFDNRKSLGKLMPNAEESALSQRAEGPENLIEGLSDYIVLQAKSSTTDTVNYQSTAKKHSAGGGWRLITKGILNKAAP